MRPKVVCSIVLGILFIAFTLIVYSSKIVGTMLSGLTIYKLNEKTILNFGYKREGKLEPKIIDIVLLDDNKKPIPNENEFFHYEFYINEGAKKDVSYEDYIFDGPLRYKKNIKGYKVENNELRIVLEINFYKKMPENYSVKIKLSYSTFGIKRNHIMETILIDEFVNNSFEEKFEQKLNNIINFYSSEISQASNPPYNLKDIESNNDYKYIVSQGKNSLNHMLSKFTKSDKDGLEEYILALACSEILEENPNSKNWSSGLEWYNSYIFNDLLNKLSEKDVTGEMLRTLYNLGFTEEEMLKLSKDEVDRIFAPGTHMDGYGFDPSKEQIEELKTVGIDYEMSVILYNLGYKYKDMLALSPTEIDFIFPNTELIENLSKKGFDKDKINTMRREGKTYKDIISDALK